MELTSNYLLNCRKRKVGGGLLVTFLSMLFLYPAYGQDIKWSHIIEEDAPLEARRIKLDSLMALKNPGLAEDKKADCLHDMGLKLYYSAYLDSNDIILLDSAISVTRRSVELKTSLPLLDTVSLQKSLYNLGFFCSKRGAFFDAIRAYSQLIGLGSSDQRTIAAYNELGMAYLNTGDYLRAIEVFRRAIEVTTMNQPDPISILYAHIRMADTYSVMGIREYAGDIEFHLDKADSIYTTHALNYDLATAQIHMLRGNLLLMLENYDESLYHLDRTMHVPIQHTNENLAMIHNSLGVCYDKLEQDEKALHHFNKSLSIHENFSYPYENLGDLYLDEADYEQGLDLYHKAIAIAAKGKITGDYQQLPNVAGLETAIDKTGLLNHLIQLANGWLRYYEHETNPAYLNKALHTFETADQLIDIIKADNREFQSKLFWREQSAKLYMKAVEACYLLGKPERAYYFMERNKALLLLEDVTDIQARALAQLPESVTEREFGLRRGILLAENRINTLADSSQTHINRLKKQVFDQKRVLDQFTDSVHRAFPEFARLKKQLPILPHKEFREHYCTGNQAVLHYILNEEQGFGLYNDGKKPVFFRLGVNKEFNTRIDTLYTRLTNFSIASGEADTYRENARRVFEMLIPLEVSNRLKGRQVLIVPDHRLQKIPFDALVTTGDKPRYLLQECELQYAYSLSYLHAKGQVKGQVANGLLAVAPVDFAALGLGRLRFSEEEVNEIHAIYGGELLINGSATKAQLLSRLQDTGILHFSTHADLEENGHHWVALRDDKLFLNEIYANKTRAQMVVLSACNTSAGALQKGEGVMSLARAFFNSGAKSVVSSLWPVDDKAGKDLMVEFYKGLDNGLTKSAALREAKLKFTRQNASLSPSYWASLIVIGDNSPIKSTSIFIDKWPWLAVGGLLVLFLGWRMYRGKASESGLG